MMDFLANLLVKYQNHEAKMAKEGIEVTPVSRVRHVECASRAALMGLSTGTITFAILFLGQKHFTRQIKGMKTRNIILSSTLFSCLTAYLIGEAKLHDCNKSFSKANSKQNEFYPGT
eukprot:GFUD01027009.1.p1 GENE.GFUD01027009.1~~GFUD01027009.1.p1  ORF type:complete len:117 (-),score=18.32 GFUD01027009.1:205-555(-)